VSREAVRREYDETAGDYDREWASYVDATTGETLRRLSLPGGARVLDVGCGTGALLNELRRLDAGRSLFGVDLSSCMLTEAARKTEGEVPLTGAVAEALPFDENEFDVVVSCNAFHFFLDPESFLAEVRRVLRPGGQLVVTDWCDDYWACWACDYYLRVTSEAHTRIFGREELRTLLDEAGFDVRRLDTYRIEWIWGLMTVRARLSP
jgi:ubiquinone/menaquinone biosynthesis C-methylase UbiE